MQKRQGHVLVKVLLLSIVLREVLKAAPSINGSHAKFQDRSLGVAFRDTDKSDGDAPAERRAHEAPLGIALAALLIGCVEGIGELQGSAEAKIKP